MTIRPFVKSFYKESRQTNHAKKIVGKKLHCSCPAKYSSQKPGLGQRPFVLEVPRIQVERHCPDGVWKPYRNADDYRDNFLSRQGGYQNVNCPPSTTNVVPVIKLASSDARNKNEPATSSAVAKRRIGIFFLYSSAAAAFSNTSALSRV